MYVAACVVFAFRLISLSSSSSLHSPALLFLSRLLPSSGASSLSQRRRRRTRREREREFAGDSFKSERRKATFLSFIWQERVSEEERVRRRE